MIPDLSSVAPLCSIRYATPEDAAALCAIYEPYVLYSAITFDTIVPTEEAMAHKIAHTLERYPFLVATLQESADTIVGYAYLSPLRPRNAYVWSVETSIYVDSSYRNHGIGRALYAALVTEAKALGIQSLFACVTCCDRDDEHLSDASLQFHRRLGFEPIGRFPHAGNKFGKWYDITWMVYPLGPYEDDPTPPLLFSETTQSRDTNSHQSAQQ